jgi:energy-coupling factor transporter ATP-binding protein EcfA2
MRLCQFEIHNFKGIQHASFEWENIIVLIGENNAGKSTVLQALECFLSGTQVKDDQLFCDNLNDSDHAIELTGHFCELSAPEQTSPAVRGRMLDDRWVLKKKFWCETEEGSAASWKEQYYSLSRREVLIGWPESDSAWPNFPPEYQTLISEMSGRGARPNTQTREQLRELVRQNSPQLVTHGDREWVPNPGGGGNWKSNANSIIPKFIFVRAVHDATEESTSKDATAYGKIVNLIVEKKLMARPEVIELKQRIEAVLKLFSPDPEHPENQAEEIRDIQDRINRRLNEVITGQVAIRTSAVEIEPMLLPSTHLVLKDRPDAVETPPGHQGHGLQRTLVMTLLQILAEIQAEPDASQEGTEAIETAPRPVVLAVEEPELYMHPQMERKMRDVLYRLARQPRFQVICTTHSPIFLDIENSQKTIVRVVKGSDRTVTFFQVSEDLFAGPDAENERERLRMIAEFHPTVNELFFANRVVLTEEESALVAFERAAQLTGLFARHPQVRHDVAIIDCRGKGSIPVFQTVLNHFRIPYTVVHDEDVGNLNAPAENARIQALLGAAPTPNLCHMISPTNLEGLLNYAAGKDRPYRAIRRVEALHAAGPLPPVFVEALNWVYFGQAVEPA